MANIVEIILKGVDKSSAAFKESTKSAEKLKGVLTGIGMAGAGIAVVGATMKKAFDLGREGAVIEQTSESFGFLMEKVNAAPDLMDQLTAASHGTISAFELQSSTMTLLAGASGELGTSLANATPRLMEIAKAANKLNPALGTTAFMYESIATGVKRAQPLILDNLGLTLKVGEANIAYAESIGKTVEEMTTQDKAMAILNATLEAGDTLIDQVGGTTDSATDSFDQLDVAVKELVDEIKKGLAPFLKKAADGLLLLLTRAKKLDNFLKEHTDEVFKSAESWEEFVTEIQRAEEVMNTELIPGADAAAKMLEFFGLVTLDATSILDDYSEAMFDARNETEDTTGATDELLAAIDALRDGTEGITAKIHQFSFELDGQARAAEKSAIESKKFLDSIDRDLASPIDNFVKDIQWFLATGGQFEAAWGRIQALAKTAPEEALGLAQELLVMIEDSRVELNMTTGDEAAQNIRDTLGVELWEANQMIRGTDGIHEAMAGIGDINIDLSELERMQRLTERILSDLGHIRSGGVDIVPSGRPSGPARTVPQERPGPEEFFTSTRGAGQQQGARVINHIYPSNDVDVEEMVQSIAQAVSEN